jgi:hypothetical protein
MNITNPNPNPSVQREMRTGRSIMVITFYKAQEALIREYFNHYGLIETVDCRYGYGLELG